jgi:hypothetical protein
VSDGFKAIVIVCILQLVMQVYPSYRTALETEESAKSNAQQAVQDFNDKARNKGYIDPLLFSTLNERLASTTIPFTIVIDYQRRLIQPIYSNPSDATTFTGSYSIDYQGFYVNDVLNQIYQLNPALPMDDPSRRFRMHRGDQLTTKVVSRGSTIAGVLRKFLFQTQDAPIVRFAGGMVRSEAP